MNRRATLTARLATRFSTFCRRSTASMARRSSWSRTIRMRRPGRREHFTSTRDSSAKRRCYEVPLSYLEQLEAKESAHNLDASFNHRGIYLVWHPHVDQDG